MPRKRPTPEEIVAKLRQIDVLVSQGKSVADADSIVADRNLLQHQTSVSLAYFRRAVVKFFLQQSGSPGPQS